MLIDTTGGNAGLAMLLEAFRGKLHWLVKWSGKLKTTHRPGVPRVKLRAAEPRCSSFPS